MFSEKYERGSITSLVLASPQCSFHCLQYGKVWEEPGNGASCVWGEPGNEVQTSQMELYIEMCVDVYYYCDWVDCRNHSNNNILDIKSAIL